LTRPITGCGVSERKSEKNDKKIEAKRKRREEITTDY